VAELRAANSEDALDPARRDLVHGGLDAASGQPCDERGSVDAPGQHLRDGKGLERGFRQRAVGLGVSKEQDRLHDGLRC
jgi:hypothetical protein